MPATVKPVKTLPPIRIYGAAEKLFTTNGLRCLSPQSAEVTLREQQAHAIHMVHPLDDEGAWRTIKMSRILYVPIMYRNVIKYQPMRIYKIQKQRQNGGNLSIAVDAKHVFYDLNSVMVQACTVSSLACQAAIAAVFSNIYRPTENAQASDAFTYSSDILGETINTTVYDWENGKYSFSTGAFSSATNRISTTIKMPMRIGSVLKISVASGYNVNYIGWQDGSTVPSQYSTTWLSGDITITATASNYCFMIRKSNDSAIDVEDYTKMTLVVQSINAEYNNVSATAALVGDENSLASIYGGELYADGFRFSINSRMEGAQDNSFRLAYNYNITGITATYSTESTYSAVVGESNITQTVQTRAVDPAALELPFDRTIYAKFSYQAGTPTGKFTSDMDKYAADNAKVSASYQATFADLPRTDAYHDFAALEYQEVGDTGTVYDEDLDINTVQKIVEKRIDVLTQTAISATLGSTPASITRPKTYANTVSNTLTAEDKAQTAALADIYEEFAAMLTPKATASGAPPLIVTTSLTAPIESWAVYGSSGGVGVTRGSDIVIAVSVNGDELAAVTVPHKLYAGDYIRRAEGGAAVLHLENDSSGSPLPSPTEQTITMPVLMMVKGSNTVTVAGTAQPETVEIIYR